MKERLQQERSARQQVETRLQQEQSALEEPRATLERERMAREEAQVLWVPSSLSTSTILRWTLL
jgi:hypothetical protein